MLVLLSTYNGEKYLEEQLNSLISQIDIHVDILVRDDGSKDHTIDILNKWKYNGYLSWYRGNNLKPAKSFLDLVYRAQTYDYYAYCDQDDVWDIDKLKIAVDEIKKYSNRKETLYCSTLRVVDKKLEFLYIKEIRSKYSLGESLIRNNVVGCTMVFNKKLLDTLRLYRPEYIEMHDSWTYRVCSAVGGNIIIDCKPHISYRQHENNVIGSNTDKISRIINRIKSMLMNRNHVCWKTSRELLQGYEKIMCEHNKKLLRKILNYDKSFRNKIILIRDKNVMTGKLYQNVLFILDVLVGNI